MATSTKDQLIRFRCKCGKKLKAARDIIGKKVQCTQCPRIHRVPESDRLGPKPKKTPKKENELTPLAKTSTAKKVATTSSETSARKKQKRATAAVSPNQRPIAHDKIQSDVAEELSSLIINDEMAAKEPSLLPVKDDSDSRFKLDPKHDPEPIAHLPAPDNSFEFDFEVDTDALPKPEDQSLNSIGKSLNALNADGNADRNPASFRNIRPSLQLAISKPTAFASIAVVLSLVLLTTIGWYVLSQPSLSAEFSERPEVKNYMNKFQEFRKSQRDLEIVSEAYVKSTSPPVQERAQIEAFNRSIKPLANRDEKLAEAFELFETSQIDQSRDRH